VFHFRTSEAYIRRFFEEGFAARDIGVSLVSFDVQTPVAAALSVMEQYDFAVIGVREAGIAVGYAAREALTSGTCGDHMVPFKQEEILADFAPMLEVLKRLNRKERVFLRVLGEVGGIVTRSDLQKAAVRMWLFGLVTVTEMVMTRFIECRYPNDTWKQHISKSRLAYAEKLLDERKRRNQEIDLLDCLQFSDKGQILIKDPVARAQLNIKSRNDGEARIKAFESLRNNLAHSQDIVAGNFSSIVNLADNLDDLLGNIWQLAETAVTACPADGS
jgi:hypothetical protein